MRKITTKQVKKLLEESESDYLDFKENYSSNSDLVKDILAFANSRTSKKYRYIIFGISDDKKIIGLNNSNRRKKQAHIISLLYNKINRMPNFRLNTIIYDGFEIDVLCIENIS